MANKRHGKGPAIPPGDPPNPGISLNPANNDEGVIVKVLEEPWSLPELRKNHLKLAAKVDSLAEMVTTLSSQLQSFLSKQAESETQSREDHISDSDDEYQHQTSQSDDAPETQPTPITDIDAKLKTLNLTHSEEEDRKNRKMEAFGGFLVDEKVVRVENIFLDFLKTFRLGGELYYDADIEAMINNESTTMFIDFSHVMTFNNLVQKAISDEFLRFEPYLRNACKRFVMERRANAMQDDVNKDINVSFFNLPASKKLWELTMAEIGKVFAPFEGTNTFPHHSLIIGDENIIDSCVEKLVNTKDEVPDDSLVVFCESLRYAHLLFDENPERDKVTFAEESETVAEAAAKQRTAMHSVLWNCVVDHFRMNDYVTSADMFEKAMLYIPFDIENRILRAKGFRVLCLCHLGLSHLDQAQEYINEAEKLEPNIASAFLKYKIYLQKKDHDGVVAQIRAMTTCLDFKPEFLALAAHEAVACRALAIAVTALSNLLNFYAPGKSMPTSEVVVLRTLVTFLNQEPRNELETLKFVKRVHNRATELGPDCFFGTGEVGRKERNWFAVTAWNLGTKTGAEKNYGLCAEFYRLASEFYSLLVDGQGGENMVCKALVLTVSAIIASESQSKITLPESEVKQAMQLLDRAGKILKSTLSGNQLSGDPVTTIEPDLYFIYTFCAYDIHGRLNDAGSQLQLVKSFVTSKASNPKFLLQIGLTPSWVTCWSR